MGIRSDIDITTKSINDMTTAERLRVVENFVLNRKDLSLLDPYLQEINIFDILKSKHHELRHSNILAWLLDPKGSHGIGDEFIKLFISKVIENNEDQKYDVLKWSFIDLSDCDVQREKHWKSADTRDSLDIFITAYQSDKPDYIIAIENKVGSSEGEKQTLRYRKSIEDEYPEDKAVKMFVYLSVDNDPPSDDKWATLSYESIIDILDHLLFTRKSNIRPEVYLIISNYRKVCAELMDQDDRKLREIVKKIYRDYKPAIDLINKYKPDLQSEIADYLGSKLNQFRAEEEQELREKGESTPESNVEPDINVQKSRVRFNTRKMSQFIKPFSDRRSCWNTTNNYYYIFSFKKSRESLYVSFTLELNVKGLDKNSTQYKNGDQILAINHYSGKNTEKKIVRTALKPIESNAYLIDYDLDETLKSELDVYFDLIMKTIADLESKLPVE